MAVSTVSELSKNVHKFFCEFDGQKDEQWLLLISDLHLDNPKCNRKLLKKHLDQAKERGAIVMIFGDLFCAMQGAKDRRGSKQALKPDQLTQPYFDAIVDDAAEFFAPYKDVVRLLTYGNHETAIIRHNEIDLLRALQLRMNALEGPETFTGGYGGWAYLQVRRQKMRQSLKLRYFHGSGGSSPVTKGAIQQQRAAAMYDADIIVQGHIHQRQQTSFMRERLTNNGNIKTYEQLHLRCPTYKDAYDDGAFGWEVEKGMGPSPLGGWWIRIYLDGDDLRYEYQVAD